MKFCMGLFLAALLFGIQVFAQGSAVTETQKPAKPATSFDKALKNYANAPKKTQTDLNKISADHQKQLDALDKKIEGP